MPTPHPILLAHGVCRFDVLWRKLVDNTDGTHRDHLHYFRGVRSMLRDRGYAAYHGNVPWAGSVAERAEALRADVTSVLDETGADKIHIIAHSMGGLDARHMLFDDRDAGRIHERVASVTTISTPHEGSPFADWGLRNLGALVPLAARMGLDLQALEDLTTAAAKRFHDDPEVVDFERGLSEKIAFRSHAGRQRWLAVSGLLKASYGVVARAEGANDGVVSVRSARWRREFFAGVWPRTDHLNQLGWWDVSQLASLEGPRRLLRRVHAFYAALCSQL